MAELIQPGNYQDFTLEMLQTPTGIAKLNSILSQLAQNISGDSESVKVYQGVGAPEASVAAGVGSLYMRTDGSSDTSVYRKESGSGDTGWVAIKAPASLPLSTANGGLGADASAWTAGDYLYLSSTGVIGHRVPAGIQIFTGSGTFVAPTGITKVYLSMVGGGGGGCNNNNTGSAGGASGGWVINYPYTVVAGNSYTVTIGTGGAGGSGVTGSNGVATSFDVLSVTGGKGATARNAGGAGTSFNASGATPGNYISSGSGSNLATTQGGGGGGSPFGIGAAPPNAAPWTGNTGGANTGAGGSGGSGDGGGNQGNGGTGGTGICIVMY